MNTLRLYIVTFLALIALSSQAQVTPTSQMEKLDRGLVVVPTSTTANFISWRLLGTDDKANTTFDLLRDGVVIASNLKVSNYQDTQGSATARYQVVTKVNGTETETSAEVLPWTKKFLTLVLNRPATGNGGGTYTPNDMSVGDVDGDGQYELFVKWDPSNSHDNSQSGKADNVYIDCYKIVNGEVSDDRLTNCQLLWRIDLGKNIRAGAHYTQFMVYDFDNDGKAEMMCKTATGSKDGLGNYVNQTATDATVKGHDNNQDYRNSDGHVLSGPEYLTIFEGITGKAIHTTWYLPGRAGTGSKTSTERGDELGKVSTFPNSFWGDNYGNRSERYLAAVAYINGADKPACGIFCRGYYTQAYVWAVSFDGTRLHTEWLHCSPSNTQWLVFASKWADGQAGLTYTIDGDQIKRIPIKTASTNTSGRSGGSNTLYGNGNHNMSIADVDGDGCDEILWGSAALNNDGTLLYATGLGHGDAIHVGKMIPEKDGYQVFQVHEENPYGWDLHDAKSGEILFSSTGSDDNGRGLAADLTGKDGWEFWSNNNRNPRSATTGKEVISKTCAVNFRIYWDGSIQDQLLDGGYGNETVKITKYQGGNFATVIEMGNSYNNPQTCNTTKRTPCLQADIFGDWREELILWNLNNPAEINIYTTWTSTNYAVPTLMHDHTYRMGIAWQNTAYNQPPHLGYYLPDYINGKIDTGIHEVSSKIENGRTAFYDLNGRPVNDNHKGLVIMRVTMPDGSIQTRKLIR